MRKFLFLIFSALILQLVFCERKKLSHVECAELRRKAVAECCDRAIKTSKLPRKSKAVDNVVRCRQDSKCKPLATKCIKEKFAQPPLSTCPWKST
ncbi:unnamed protein product [Calicophoron daubneyi]|uniref:Uncharacterized protein n=1 Tax=Calicophoron daubneyi TaxID=300641 RepID=A0AAV2TUI9_CALDB